ncbi:MAG: glycosyltransferase family 2 protein [Kiritimatiellae bacterium]|nr:glycosyltransferase family 2 protein [Kiritimatiellia bacterium]
MSSHQSLVTSHSLCATEKTVSPLFSIIIPVYNVAPYLRECLDSVLEQSFTDWECLCVDDGSTDHSGRILDEYTAKDNRFRIWHQANAGVSAARNRALDNAIGDFVLFLDSDDRLLPECLKRFNAVASDTDWCLCNVHEMTAEGAYVRLRRRKINALWERCDFSAEIQSVDLYCVWGICFKRKWLNDVALRFDTRLTVAEDTLFMSQALLTANRIQLAGDWAGYAYRLPNQRGSLMERNNQAYLLSYVQAARWIRSTAISSEPVGRRVLAFWGQLLCACVTARRWSAGDRFKIYREQQPLTSEMIACLPKNICTVIRIAICQLTQSAGCPYWLWRIGDACLGGIGWTRDTILAYLLSKRKI